MAKKTKKVEKKETPAQRLSGIIKSCRQIMRKDKGMNGDADRLPMLTWLMFLKFMDDKEQELEANAILNDKKYRPVITSPYRWRDWAKDLKFSGDDLLNFINKEKATFTDGKERTGLLFYLRNLQSESGKERKDVLSTVFKGLSNRMISGSLLRDVVNKIDEIHFTSNEEVNTLSLLYESLLKEMRDASGDAGEFYTPRPVVKFMVEMLNPQLGETILDPAAGTGGFLVSAFEHTKKQAKSTEQYEILQKSTIQGGEAKPLPYLLCQMNLLLHGLEFPDIDPDNSLRFKLQEISDGQRVDIVLTNPPFGGEEERGILNNFPADKQTAETTLLFLQLIMRKLRRKTPEPKGGRAAVVVPNGTLFADGVAAKIKKQLLEDFNLHTIVRLGDGVFAPYTDIPANLLFFEQGTPTETIWFYDLETPEGQKKYSKTKPIQNDEFDTLNKWWTNRKETDFAWKVDFKGVLADKTAQAQPFWDNATEAKSKIQLAKEALKKEEENAKAEKDNAQKLEKTEAEIKRLKTEIQEQEIIEKENQKQGDSIYWTAFNLDIKNPNKKGEYEYQEPEKLIASILQKENRIMELMKDIQQTITKKEVAE